MNPRRVAPSWKDVEWLRSILNVPLVLKGLLEPDDAERALDSGAEGIIVSNHGGRNLDTLPATIDALPRVTSRIRGRVPVLVDGGIRRGTDIVKALGLGATAVLIGRQYCYGLSYGGAEGVRLCLDILVRELEMAFILIGRQNISQVDETVLYSAQAAR